MARKSIFEIANKDKAIKEMMEDCYVDLQTADKATKFLSTNVIPLNLLLSGKVGGGVPVGKMTMISAPSMLGKSFIAMSVVRNAQKEGMQVIIIDTERAFKPSMAATLGIDIDPKKLFVIEDSRIEEITKFLLSIFEGMTKADKENTLVVFDSWGPLITSKSLKDGITGNDVIDMTIPKKKNNLANILLYTRATYVVVNHVYSNTGGFGDPLAIPGGRKIVFNSECVLLGMSRSKDKNADKSINGHIVTTKTFKSRYSKGESRLKFRIKNDGGLDPYYGVLDDAIEGGYIVKEGTKYSRSCVKDDKPVFEKTIYNSKFWKPIFKETDFKDFLEKKYTFSSESDIVTDEKDLDEIFS